MFSNIQTFLIAILVVTPPLYINPSLIRLFEAGCTGGGKGGHKDGVGWGGGQCRKSKKNDIRRACSHQVMFLT